MSKVLKYTALVLLAGFIIIQFFRGDFPENRTENPNDIFETVEASVEVKNLIRAACYDCHSMETKYPWYSQVAPVSWWIIDHIEEGRDELNFSDFNTYKERRMLRKLKEIAEEVEGEKMPLPSYIRGHSEARLTDEQRVMIQDWASQSAKTLLEKSEDQ